MYKKDRHYTVKQNQKEFVSTHKINLKYKCKFEVTLYINRLS